MEKIITKDSLYKEYLNNVYNKEYLSDKEENKLHALSHEEKVEGSKRTFK